MAPDFGGTPSSQTAVQNVSQHLNSLRSALAGERGRIAELLQHVDVTLECLDAARKENDGAVVRFTLPSREPSPNILNCVPAEGAIKANGTTGDSTFPHAGTNGSKHDEADARPTVVQVLAPRRDGFATGKRPSASSPRPSKQVIPSEPGRSLLRRGSVAQVERLNSSTARTKTGNCLFADRDMMKEAVQQAILTPDYDVKDLYKDTGCFQALARSPLFEGITLLVILLNSLWLSIETDNNEAALLIDADVPFIVAENVFCAFFTFELSVRFVAFAHKNDTLKDRWFVFDSVLVFTMILETWVLTLAVWASGSSVSADTGSSSILRVVRLFRLSRAARIAKLLKAVPELQVIVRGVMIVTRTVVVIFGLLIIILYVYAIIFTQLSKGTKLEQDLCPSVPACMSTLLLGGIIPDMRDTTLAFAAEHVFFAAFFFTFVLLAFVTIMNMLIGVLVEVISVVASVEKETNQVAAVKRVVSKWAPIADEDGNGSFGKGEFYRMLNDPGCARDLNEVGVDAIALIDYTDFLFREKPELSFAELLSVVLGLRGRNETKVNDLVELRKFLHIDLNRLEMSIDDLRASLMSQECPDGDPVRRESFAQVGVGATSSGMAAARKMRDEYTVETRELR